MNKILRKIQSKWLTDCENIMLIQKGCVNMEVTDIRVRKVNKEGKMKAVVSVTFDNEIVIHDIKVIEREEGLFIAMPSRRTADGEFRDVAHPINAETRNKIQKLVLEKYEAALLEEEAFEREHME